MVRLVGFTIEIRCKSEFVVRSVIQIVPGCEFSSHLCVLKRSTKFSDGAPCCHQVQY
jgi:hypothetical protein